MPQDDRAPEAKIVTTVGALGEDEVVERLSGMLTPGTNVIAGPGDDCAVIDTGALLWQLLKTDCLIEGVHFQAGTNPRLVGRKAINRVLSDIAAMGGSPGEALVTLVVDPERSIEEIEGWYEGMIASAAEWGCHIVGGETSRLPFRGAVISVSMTGKVSPDQCVFRTGAKSGDIIAVTGRLGGSFVSERHLTFSPRLAEAQWLVSHAKPTAMMDLSDGLGSDLPRLTKASGKGYRVDSSTIPCHVGISPAEAVCDGEDYELLLTFAPDLFRMIRPEWEKAFPATSLTAIGEVTEFTNEELPSGWDHFRNE